MSWSLEDTGRVCGYDPFLAIALDRTLQRWRRPMAWYNQIHITRLVARDPLYWWPRQALYAAYAVDCRITYVRLRFERRLRMWKGARA